MAAGRQSGTDGRPPLLELTLEEAASAMGGELEDSSARSIRPAGASIDSRSIREGEIFFAIEGPRFDGHDFVGAAFEAGAVCAVVRHGFGRNETAGPTISVTDTVAALQGLAAHYRGVLDCSVIAVTGSNGKTTTKDLVAHVLAGTRQVSGTRGNLNNYLGVPLTLLSLRAEHEAAVIEMGASTAGEIAMLARIARPQLGVITNVGPTHLEEMGTVEKVAAAKSELLSELAGGGTLIVNGDDEILMSAIGAVSRQDVRIVRCGFGADCDVRAASCRSIGSEGMEFGIEGLGEATIPALGRHSVYNALLAVAVSMEMGVPFGDVRERLSGFTPPSLRLQVLRAGGVVVLNDSYNSNPASAAAALGALEDFPARGRRIAVLGDMLELGPDSARLHRELGARARSADRLLVLGRWARDVIAGAVEAGLDPGKASAFEDKPALVAELLSRLGGGDVVLIKASRAMGMDEVAAAIEERLSKGA